VLSLLVQAVFNSQGGIYIYSSSSKTTDHLQKKKKQNRITEKLSINDSCALSLSVFR
jgi:hypothetical protein